MLFFIKPFTFKPFTSGFDEMYNEDEVRSSEDITMDSLIGYDIGNGTVTTEEYDDTDASRIIDSALINECQNTIQTQRSEELDERTEKRKCQPKMYVPELKAFKYKAQIIAEPAVHGKISSDRLTRIREVASSCNKTDISPTDKYLIRLFNFIAIKDDKDSEFFIGKVIRILRMYKTNTGRSRKIDYVRPVNIKDPLPEIMCKVNVLQKENQGYQY